MERREVNFVTGRAELLCAEIGKQDEEKVGSFEHVKCEVYVGHVCDLLSSSGEKSS